MGTSEDRDAAGANHGQPRPSWKKLMAEAREHFGVKELRPGQQESIEALLDGEDVLGVMPTGAGKSLTFQLPALLLPKATVVVSPRIGGIEAMLRVRTGAEGARRAADGGRPSSALGACRRTPP